MKRLTSRWSTLINDPRSREAFASIFELINSELNSIENGMHQQMKTVDPDIEHYLVYAIEGSGKRLRPLLVLLAAGATGHILSEHINLGIIIELLHVASLIHDDIMDSADRRRDQPTLNRKWGNSLTVLVGDVLFANALRLTNQHFNSDICRRISDAISDVCTGEILQTQRRFDLNLSIAEYYRMLQMKTGSLFAVSCELAAILTGSSPAVCTALKHYGTKMGIAYQVLDDCIDLVGKEDVFGKTLGTDIVCGKFTLPVLVFLESSSPQEREIFEKHLLAKDSLSSIALAEFLRSHGALVTAVKRAQLLLDEAESELLHLQENAYTSALRSMSLYFRTTLDSVCQAHH